MTIALELRPAASPHVTEIWHARSEDAGSFVSMASSYWEIVVTRNADALPMLTVRGPETIPTSLSYPKGVEWFGIRFTLDSFVPQLPVNALVDRAVNLPVTANGTFRFAGAEWKLPEYATADRFVDQLMRTGRLVREPVVEAALAGCAADISRRTVQRRFVQAIGLTHNTIKQIERARHALDLLQQGALILDVVHEAGYYDQPHLTRSMRRWLGQTPGHLINAEWLG